MLGMIVVLVWSMIQVSGSWLRILTIRFEEVTTISTVAEFA